MVFTWWFHIIFHRCVKLYVKNQMKISHVLHMHFTSFLPVVRSRLLGIKEKREKQKFVYRSENKQGYKIKKNPQIKLGKN